MLRDFGPEEGDVEGQETEPSEKDMADPPFPWSTYILTTTKKMMASL